VPARLDLQLHALIALLDAALRQLDRLLDRVLDAQRDADGDVALAATEEHPQRHAQRLGLEGPERHLHGRNGHVVTTHVAHGVEQLGRGREAAPHNMRRDEVLDHVPGGVHRLVGIARELAGHALGDALQALGEDRHQGDAAVLLHTGAGPERELEAHRQLAELDTLYLHLLSAYLPRVRGSNASLSPSPSRLTPKVVTKIDAPGMKTSHHIVKT